MTKKKFALIAYRDEKWFIKISQLKLLYKHIDIIEEYNTLKIVFQTTKSCHMNSIMILKDYWKNMKL